MKLADISWPVYKLGTIQPLEEDGVVFYLNQYKEDEDVKIRIVDDTNVFGESLAVRRMQLMKDKAPLFKIKQAVFFLSDLIKLAKGSRVWFIDSRGRTFQYKKSRLVSLTFVKIEKVFPIKTGGSILLLQGLEQRFKTMYKVDPKLKYAGLLELDSKTKLLYGLYEEQPKDTRRKV
jgi:hypothetical protein